MRDDRFEVTETQISDLIRSSQCHRFFSPSWPIFPPISTDCRWYFQHIFSIRWFRCVSAPRFRCTNRGAPTVDKSATALDQISSDTSGIWYHPIDLASCTKNKLGTGVSIVWSAFLRTFERVRQGLSFTKLVAVQNANQKAEGNGHTMVRE